MRLYLKLSPREKQLLALLQSFLFSSPLLVRPLYNGTHFGTLSYNLALSLNRPVTAVTSGHFTCVSRPEWSSCMLPIARTGSERLKLKKRPEAETFERIMTVSPWFALVNGAGTTCLNGWGLHRAPVSCPETRKRTRNLHLDFHLCCCGGWNRSE